MELDIEKTYGAIRKAAVEGRFVTYGALAAASGVPWKEARRLVPIQLGRLVEIGHERDWPVLPAIVVNKENLETGLLEGDALKGFLSAARSIGLSYDDPQVFLKSQQRAVFEWGKTAPEMLGLDEKVAAEASGGPHFVAYFQPVLNALRALGGEASPDHVYAWLKANLDAPKEEFEGRTKANQSKFENRVGWARFYLAKAGLIDGARRGHWVLTPEGREATLDHAAALALFREVRAQFKAADDEEEAAPEEVSGPEILADPDRCFWFVGAVWNKTDDQTERFLTEGIWQNGDDEMFSEHVSRMKPGDRIAIKASFTQKYGLPFDNRGKTVSCMRLKAIGTITESTVDGTTVRVDWTPLDPPRDWYFYTYRVAVVEADPSEDLARRLIIFAFAGGKQDHDFWLNKVPYFARRYGEAAESAAEHDPLEAAGLETEEEAAAPSYTLESILAEGCFLQIDTLQDILRRVEAKKNLVLQGPPGTGKTWLAKRLAYALIGSKDRKVTHNRLRIIQFHPSLSYEDFVRGWRPSGEGKLTLTDGLFLQMVEAAKAEPDRPFVLVIEEINRGNPAQIFGEVLTLLEDAKRNREDAMELAYPRDEGERVYVPRNLHVIGTMNIADRSLALVDLALRRRFSFIDLTPQLNGSWRQWCTERCKLSGDDVTMIEQRLGALNDEIAEDRSLGAHFRIGHSYVTPLEGTTIADGRKWFRDVAQTEIIPLLEEYWFDAPDKVKAAAHRLTEGL